VTEVLRFDRVGMQYGNGPYVLQDSSFTLRMGTLHFLTGASGAGKSTLLKLTHLAMRQTEGRIKIFGRDSLDIPRHELPGIRRRMGIVFQDFRLIPHLSAFENVALPLRVGGAQPKQIKKHVNELLDWVGLGDHVNALPHRLSGGQQQRVAIARAVIGRPSLLLADEPTGNVDDEIAMRLMYLFNELNKIGTTILIATHSQTLVNRFNHPCLHIDAGQVRLLPRASLPEAQP
jgi:cell division transport system ATP-binding protein